MVEQDILDTDTNWTHIQHELQQRHTQQPTPSQDSKLELFIERARQEKLGKL
jgi:hypothetical protein